MRFLIFLQLRGYEKERKLYLPYMKMISGTYLYIYLYLHWEVKRDFERCSFNSLFTIVYCVYGE